MKHAYLILAHGEMPLVPTLLRCIDDARNDIYLHVDKKTRRIPDLHTEKARLQILTDRVDVRWGDVSMLEAELKLFEAALLSGEHYAYLHLLSGVDLPLKTQDEIHRFCEENQGKEFIGYCGVEETPEMEWKMHRWHPFPKHFRDEGLFFRGARKAARLLQDGLHIRRHRGVHFLKGAQWVSVTEAMARLFVGNREWILKTFHHTFCSDEIAMQTLCWNSPLRENIYSLNGEWAGNLRKIGWKNGDLKDWTAADYDEIVSSGALFARKFNGSDPAFIQKIAALSQ